MSDAPKLKLKSIPGGKAGSSSTPTPTPLTPPLPGSPSSRLPRRASSTGEQSPITTTGEFAREHPVLRKAFGRYELLMQMGTGGMATLFLARIRGPKDYEKLLAIKKIHEHLLGDPEFISMFRDEARIAALIHHPNVVSTFDLGEIDGAYFIAMEYVHGQTLRDVVKASGRRKDPLDWANVVRIVSDVAKGLHAAHELRSHEGEPLDVIHRDVSPQNVLVSYDGHVKLVDFGVAYAAERITDTGAGKLKGKVGYMSPEQASGIAIDRRSDIFSLATILFEAVTGRRLFNEDTDAATLLKVREADVPLLTSVNADLPGELDSILQCALARDRDARFDTAEDFSEALDELLALSKRRRGRKHLSGMMEDLFHQRKRIKDRMVRRARANTTDTPLMGIEAIDDETSSAMLSKSATEGALPARDRSPLLYVIAGVGVLLLAALVLVLVWPKGENKNNSAATTPPRAMRAQSMQAQSMQAQSMQAARPGPQKNMHRRPAAVQSVMLTVQVSPRRAKSTITFRGEVQKGPIFQAVLPRSSKREEVIITAKGYLPRMVPVVLSQALTLPVELQLDDKKRRRRRRRRKKDMEPAQTRPMSMLIDL